MTAKPRPGREPVQDIRFIDPGLLALGAEYVELRHMSDDYPYIEYYQPSARTKRRYRWLI